MNSASPKHPAAHPRKAGFVATTLALSLLLHSPAQAQDDDTVATVNGKPISATLVQTVMQQTQHGGQQLDQKMVIDELINIELLAQSAATAGLDKKPEIAAALELQRKQALANAYMRELSEEIEVSDEAVLAAYNEQAAKMSDAEYRASHILVEQESEANELIKELGTGADFANLAKANSTGPSAESGGDLGWFEDGMMVAPFMAAVKQLKKGGYTQTPVETEFGWHVIKLVDTRGKQVPPFEQVEEQVRTALIREQLGKRMEAIRSEAKITMAGE